MNMQTIIKEYKSPKEFNRDAPKMAKKGWSVLSTTNSSAKSGVGRKAASVAMPIFMFLPHKDHIIVTYQRFIGK
jgi:hypothetical protein